jgi:hypothetical protein
MDLFTFLLTAAYLLLNTALSYILLVITFTLVLLKLLGFAQMRGGS